MPDNISGYRVLCIAPAWNEENRITTTISEIPKNLVETILVIDDGSSDQTAERAKKQGAHVISHTHNQGVGSAIRTGIEYGLVHNYDIVVVISGAGKTPAQQIPLLLEPILKKGVELVQGSRYLIGGEYLNMPLYRRWGTRAYAILFSFFCQHHISDASSGFRAIKLSLFQDKRINLWQKWLDRYELEPYLLFQSLHFKHQVLEVPVTIRYPKIQTGSSYTKMKHFLDWWKIFRPIIFLALKIKK